MKRKLIVIPLCLVLLLSACDSAYVSKEGHEASNAARKNAETSLDMDDPDWMIESQTGDVYGYVEKGKVDSQCDTYTTLITVMSGSNGGTMTVPQTNTICSKHYSYTLTYSSNGTLTEKPILKERK